MVESSLISEEEGRTLGGLAHGRDQKKKRNIQPFILRKVNYKEETEIESIRGANLKEQITDTQQRIGDACKEVIREVEAVKKGNGV